MSYKAVSEESHQDLLDLLQQQCLIPHFQPVVLFAEQKIIGYDCVIHGPQNSHLHAHFDLFHTAACSGHLLELELLGLKQAIAQFSAQALQGKLFIQLSLTSLFHSMFHPSNIVELLHEHHLSTQSLVLGITDIDCNTPLAALKKVISAHQNIGCQFALDHFGHSNASFRLLTELRPHYIKTDPYFTKDLDSITNKNEVLRAVRNIANHLNCQLIIKGIQNEAEYQAICQLKLASGQGDYFASFATKPLLNLPTTLFELLEREKTGHHQKLQRSKTVACLIIKTDYAKPTSNIETISEIFYKNPSCHSVPIVNSDKIPIGIVRRHELMQMFLSRYGRDLHGRKPIAHFMEVNPPIFDMNTTLEEASHHLTSNIKLVPENNFIICDQGRYVGVGQIMDLLRKMTELQIHNARYANPLTQLPGNVPIYEHIEHLLHQKQTFAVCYCDLDNFKPYNDVYGYDNGDRVIKAVAQILSAKASPEEDFVGHIGGDDFILVMQSADWKARCQAVLTEFAKIVPSFYNKQHLEANGIHSVDRKGHKNFFSLLSLSIGAVMPDVNTCRSHHDVAALATESKHQAKNKQGNQFHVDRRCTATNYQKIQTSLE